jgi:hypothetical protein
MMRLNTLVRKNQDAVLIYYSCKVCNMHPAMNRACAERRTCFGAKGCPIVLAFQFPGILAEFISEIRAQYRAVTTRPKKKKKSGNPQHRMHSTEQVYQLSASFPYSRLNNKMIHNYN